MTCRRISQTFSVAILLVILNSPFLHAAPVSSTVLTHSPDTTVNAIAAPSQPELIRRSENPPAPGTYPLPPPDPMLVGGGAEEPDRQPTAPGTYPLFPHTPWLVGGGPVEPVRDPEQVTNPRRVQVTHNDPVLSSAIASDLKYIENKTKAIGTSTETAHAASRTRN